MSQYSVNTWTISGNCTRDAELRSLTSGASVLNVGVAVNDRRKEGEEWVDDPSFFEVECWGSLAETTVDRLTKGAPVTVSGKAKQDRWEDKETGGNRSKVKLVAFSIHTHLPRSDTQELVGVGVTDDIPY